VNEDLKQRTKQFALRMIRLFGSLPKTTGAQVLGNNFSAPERRLGQTTARHIGRAVSRSSSPNAVTPFESSRNLPTG
jgi:hypothetical protein